MKKITLAATYIVLMSHTLYADVIYVTPAILGYHLAQKIKKSMPKAQDYEYDQACMAAARKALRKGVNVRISTVHRKCMLYIKHPELQEPKKIDADYTIESMKY